MNIAAAKKQLPADVLRGLKVDQAMGTNQPDRAMNVTRREYLKLALATQLTFPLVPEHLFAAAENQDPLQDPLIAWLRYNTFAADGMPRSFEVPKDPEQARIFWESIGDDTITGVMERMSINDGLSLYDGAVWQIALAAAGGVENLEAAGCFYGNSP